MARPIFGFCLSLSKWATAVLPNRAISLLYAVGIVVFCLLYADALPAKPWVAFGAYVGAAACFTMAMYHWTVG